jgi:hypothetical protein
MTKKRSKKIKFKKTIAKLDKGEHYLGYTALPSSHNEKKLSILQKKSNG